MLKQQFFAGMRRKQCRSVFSTYSETAIFMVARNSRQTVPFIAFSYAAGKGMINLKAVL